MNQVPTTDKMERGFNTAGQAIADGQTIRQMQTTYATAVAVQKPRELAIVEKNCLAEAALAGEGCYYGWGEGKDHIEGPTIDCGMIAVRNWGNAAVEMRPLAETPDAYIMEAAFIDLETGFTYTRQFRQSKKWKVYGNLDEERKADIRFQIGQSKAQRNVVLKALPAWLIDKMIEKAKEGVREKLERFIKKNGIEAARGLALKSLAKHGVSRGRIEDKYQKKYGVWDVDLLITLSGDIRALEKGAESSAVLYPTTDDQKPKKPTSEGAGLSPSDMSAGDPKDHQGHEVDEKTGEVTPAKEPDAPEAEPPPEAAAEDEDKPEPGKTEVETLMEKNWDDLVVEATSLALELETSGITTDSTAYRHKMVAKKVLNDATLDSTKNNKGHLARFIVAISELIRIAGPDGSAAKPKKGAAF